MQQDRLIFIVFILLLLFKQTSQSKYFQPYKSINQAHSGHIINFVKICSKQTFIVTASYYQIKIWKYSTLVNLITYNHPYPDYVLFVQLHPIDCRIFISLSNSTILVLNGKYFSQIQTFNYPVNAFLIVFIPQKDVFYLGGYNRNKIDKYNANTYSLMTNMDIPSGVQLMDGYYNHQLGAIILGVCLNNGQLKVYNMETNSQINLTINFNNNFYNSLIKFTKSGKFLFAWNFAYKCLNVFNLNQNKNSFQQFSKVCNINYNYLFSWQLISTAYSDDFAITIDTYNNTLKMVQLILKKQFKKVDDYQLFNNNYIYCMSQVNKIIALGTSNGNVILVKVNYPFTWWIQVIGGIIFFLVMVLIIVIICYWYKEQFPCFKSNKIQNEQQNKIKQNLTIKKNTIKLKKEKKNNKHLIKVKDTLNDSKLNLIQEEQESSNKIMLREKQQLKEYENQTELKIQEEQTVQYNDQQLYEQNRQSLYQQIQEQKRQNIYIQFQLSKKANKISNKIKLQPIVSKKTSFKQENKEDKISSNRLQEDHQKQLQKKEVKQQKSKKQDSDEFE